MTEKRVSLQDRFLEALKAKKVKCILFTMNGVQIHGYIRSYDNFTVYMEDDKRRQNLVYKHAISTISPSEFVKLDMSGTDKVGE